LINRSNLSSPAHARRACPSDDQAERVVYIAYSGRKISFRLFGMIVMQVF